MSKRTMVAMSALLLAMAATLVVQARDGRLGERIRERLQERRAASAAVGTAAQPGPPGAIRAPGLYRYSLEHDSHARQYLVYVPAGYVPGRAMPVVHVFHGGGGHMELMADDARSGLVHKADEAGFIAVFPNGWSRRADGRFATWNAGACCADARDRGIDDVGFVRRVHADVARRLAVDPRRVFATGMSNGGMMAYRLACDAADLVRAVAAVAGTDNTRECRPSRPVGILHVHARDDSHVLFDGGAGPDAFRDRSKITEFTSVPATVDAWVRRNGCSVPPRRVLDRPGARCELHAPCRGDGRVQLCVTDTGGHSWPGTAASGRRSPSGALEGTDVIWAFFAGY